MKKFLGLILALMMVLSMVPAASAVATDKDSAEILYELGLFRGTGTNDDGTPIFDLQKTPTRNQAIIMLVRLLGKEEEALAGEWDLPFTDVVKGSTSYYYIGHAYANGLPTARETAPLTAVPTPSAPISTLPSSSALWAMYPVRTLR